jgi:DNA recombination protein RmuC
MSLNFVLLAMTLTIAIVGAGLAAVTFVRLARINPATQQQILTKLNEVSLAHQTSVAALGAQITTSTSVLGTSIATIIQNVGEIEALATGFGDLKRIFTTPQGRGAVGEVVLGNVFADFLSPEQYARNVEVKPFSNQRVEYAVRFPGDEDTPLWLAVDAKLRMTEDFQRLAAARGAGDVAAAEKAERAFESQVRAAAKDISSKYIAPPYTTEFAVMFVPSNAMHDEIDGRPGLEAALQREFHVMVAGPRTLVSLLLAFRMGFRSLAVQKRAGDVRRLLSEFKTEFGKFDAVTDRLQRNLAQGQGIVGELNTRLRVMARLLAAVETMPESEADLRLRRSPTEPSQAEG